MKMSIILKLKYKYIYINELKKGKYVKKLIEQIHRTESYYFFELSNEIDIYRDYNYLN